jgi:site-specific DNA recombinase
MPTAQIRLPWSANTKTAPSSTEHCRPERSAQPDPNAVQAIARAQYWATALSDRKYASVEELAASAKPHAKVVRNELRLAFLSPDIVDAVLAGSGGFGLRHILESGARHRRGFRLHALS